MVQVEHLVQWGTTGEEVKMEPATSTELTTAMPEVDILTTLPFYEESSGHLRLMADQSISLVRRISNPRIKARAEGVLEKTLQRSVSDERAQRVLSTLLSALRRLHHRLV